MSHYQTIQSLGTPIVVHSGITQMLGSMTASALLSHIMYWSERTDNPLGFYRTLDELKAETSLSDNELRTARKLLVKLGLVTETHKRLEHRLYFKFNAQVFDDLFGEHLANCENPHLGSCEIHNPPPVKSTTGEMLNPHLGSCEIHSSLYTKITTKNTTKITDKECVGENPPTQQPKHTDENTQQTLQNPKNSKSDKQAGKNSSAKKFINADELIQLGVDEQIANDYLATRKTKLTQTAINLIIKQCQLADINLNSALEFCIEHSWQSFKAEWYFNRISSNQTNSQPKQAKTNFFDELAELDRQERQARGLAQ